MSDLLQVTLPVFLVLSAGYAAVWRGVFSDDNVDALMRFTQNFAIPCLLFAAISRLDLQATFDWRLLVSYYTGTVASFFIGMAGARLIFGRPMTDAVAIGFCCFFANTLLLGLPIMSRAYGEDSLGPVFAIISLHAPIGYLLGITTMEMVRSSGKGVFRTLTDIVKQILHNAIMIGIFLGFVANIGHITLPGVVMEAIDLIARAGLPAALFGLGGVLYRYKPEGDLKEVAFICLTGLVLQPIVVWGMARGVFSLSTEGLRAAVVVAAMAPGVNTYVFANMYGVAKRVAATSVLLGTALCILTTAVWLTLLP
ncbi:AEC family transporter [Tropicimonas sp. S265A]|uniref:AEC family transporter n=1 Tax=Tropicimonas sp. S265A TaxID=3415134 RepID=UPI003C7A1987